MKEMFTISTNVNQSVLTVVQMEYALDQILVFVFRDTPEILLTFVYLHVRLAVGMVNASLMVLANASQDLPWIFINSFVFLFVVKDVRMEIVLNPKFVSVTKVFATALKMLVVSPAATRANLESAHLLEFVSVLLDTNP